MTIDIQDLINVLAQICDDRQLKATISESFKAGLLTGFSTLIGGLLGGRAGVALGAAVGGAVALAASSDDLKPVSEILINMDQKEKELLYSRIKDAFRNVGPEDLTLLLPLLMRQRSLQDIAVKEVSNFLYSNFNARVA